MSLQSFGLATPVSFQPSNAFIAVPGTQRLGYLPTGPEGVLLKRVANVSEAVLTGGLFLYSRYDPQKWIMYIGRTLDYVLANALLGKVYGFPGGNDVFTFKDRPSLYGRREFQDGTGRPNLVRTYISGDFLPTYALMDYFGQETSDVVALAVVTSATEGLGQSLSVGRPLNASNGILQDNLSTGVSFMATHVPMQVPFSTFISGVKSTAIARVPSSVRGYYERTFSEVLSAFPGRDIFPTLAACTFWEGASLSNGAFYSPAVVDQGQPIIPWLHVNTINPPSEWMLEENNGLPAPIQVDIATTKFRVVHRTGYAPPGVDYRLPLMSVHKAWQTSSPLPQVTGVIGGLQVGVIRDGHTLYRSVVEGRKFSSVPSTIRDLGEYASLLTDPSDYALMDDYSATQDVAVAGSAAQSLAQTKTTPSIYARGTLPEMIDAFSAQWDTAAYALADREN